MFFVVKETLEGGGGYTGGGDRYVHCSKKGYFIEMSQVLSLIVVDHLLSLLLLLYSSWSSNL